MDVAGLLIDVGLNKAGFQLNKATVQLNKAAWIGTKLHGHSCISD